MKRNLLRTIAIAMAALALVNYLVRVRGREADPALVAVRTDLNPWDLTGCWTLRLDPWEFDRLVVLGGDGAAVDSAALDPSAVTVEIPLMVPPGRVRLVADSTDEWRRDATTYRAFALGDDADRFEGRLRWLVRADTLWLLWSDRDARAGIALFEEEDRFVGAARASSRVAAVTGTARAVGWRIDCSTFEVLSAEDRKARP